MTPDVFVAVAYRTLAYTALCALMFVPLEHLLGRPEPRMSRRTDLWFATVGAFVTQVAIYSVAGVALLHASRIRWFRGFGSLPFALGLPDWLATSLQIGAGVVVFELAGYAYHRLAHRSALLWRLHAVHHSAPKLDWLASFRQHPLEILAMTLVQNVPLALLGIPLGPHFVVVLFLKLNTVFVHSNLPPLPRPLAFVFADPAFHHRHHDRAQVPRNFAAVFPLIDRMFGTFDGNRADEVGLATDSPRTFFGLLAWPFTPVRRRERRSNDA